MGGDALSRGGGSIQNSDIEHRKENMYVGPDVTGFKPIADDLREVVSGQVRFDEYVQLLYATDGSIYQSRPAGVVHPTNIEDVQAAVKVAAKHDIPVIARGAGSSLAGQAVGPGCVVIDCSTHMTEIVEIDPEEKRARVQPGVVQDRFDEHAAQWKLKFAPDPASSNRATIGGGIGNNSTGAHSVRYGITDAYTEELQVVLADGTLIHTREVVLDSKDWDAIIEKDGREAEIYRTVREIIERNSQEIERRYPPLKRNVSGYNLNRVIYKNDDGEKVINLSKLVVGSESTLGIVVEAELSLVTIPDNTTLVLVCFDDLIDAIRAVPEVLTLDPSAIELMDGKVFRLARESETYAQYEAQIPEGSNATLLIEFDSELHSDLKAPITATIDTFVENGPAFDAVVAHTDREQADLWKLRKAAIPLLMSLEGDCKPYPFIEDATVPPDELAEYVAAFQEILDEHETSAAYFAHAGSGTLHIRPVLNLKQEQGIETMKSISEAVTDLVLDRHGSFSGEHGDGLARTEFNRKMYGERLWDAFKRIKTTFDPGWQMNPGKVVYRDDRPTDMRENLRYGAQYQSIEPVTTLDFSPEGGFNHLIELCNGCGTCRQMDEVMCPTYKAVNDELLTTRGRANLLRAAISGELSREELYTDRFQAAVLDLCVGCKGCKSDCPTGVDLAKLKAELKHQYHERTGPSLRSQLFANIDRYAKFGSRTAPLSKFSMSIPGARVLAQRVFGIAPERSLPPFQRQSLQQWYASRGSRVRERDADWKVLLLPDTYTNYSYPGVGKAAIRVLEAANGHVHIPNTLAPTGRSAYSVGMLDVAHTRVKHNVDRLIEYVDTGWDLLTVEPSDAAMIQDEYIDLYPTEKTTRVATHTYGVMEYIDHNELVDLFSVKQVEERLAYHGHCHQKAMGTDHHAATVLERIGYDIDVLNSGCCGMAGSFGFEDEHYDLSMAIGQLLFDQIDDSHADTVVAPGGSCRSQIGECDHMSMPRHPVEKIDEVLCR